MWNPRMTADVVVMVVESRADTGRRTIGMRVMMEKVGTQRSAQGGGVAAMRMRMRCDDAQVLKRGNGLDPLIPCASTARIGACPSWLVG